MNKLSKQKRDQLILVTIGAILVLGCLWYFVINSQSRALATASREASEMREQVDSARRLLQRTDEIAEELVDTTARLQAIEESMASGDLYSWIITTVNEFIAAHNVSIPAFSREVIRDVEMFPKFPYQSAVFTVRGTGFYHDIGAFLADFENSFPYFAIRNLRLAPIAAPAHGQRETLEFEFEIVTLLKPATS
jgi:Tfp pilus assembly protein PilO